MVKTANLVLRFLLELTALAGLGYWGAQSSTSTPVRVSLAIVLPLAMVVIWGAFVAPKARYGGSRALRLAVGLLVLFAAGAAIAHTGYPTFGLGFGIVALLNTVLAYAMGPQPGETSTK